MDENKNDNTGPTEEQKRTIKITFYVTGALFILAGMSTILLPSFFEKAMGIDGMAAKTFSMTLIVIGVIDIAIYKFLFKDMDRK